MPGSPAVPARVEFVDSTVRRTRLRRDLASVDTIEHLCAALFVRQIDDLYVDVDGPELPIADGSFAPWVALLEEAGMATQAGEPLSFRVREAFSVEDGDAKYQVQAGNELSLSVAIEWSHPLIGRQQFALPLNEVTFRDQVAKARTFGFASEVAALRAQGLLLGASAECAIVLTEDGLARGDLHWPDEFARHKLGDLAGDLMLVGGRLQAHVSATRPSHRGNVTLARTIAHRAILEGAA
jgi:UDP-3-O-acyl N-acetylglucosamine deacetylase